MVRNDAPIVLLTDLGTKDHYVGVIKGVILLHNPKVRIIDLSHEVEPQDVMGAYYLLQNSYRYFIKGTIFVVVVDPGVGTDRKLICVTTQEYTFLAPDNGVLGFLYRVDKIRKIYNITNSKYFLPDVSSTFHGRDMLAPVAGRLSGGLAPRKLGKELEAIHRLNVPSPKILEGGVVEGEVIFIDTFGNLVTNISPSYIKSPHECELSIRGLKIEGMGVNYEWGRKGHFLALVGSSGSIEVAVNRGSAAKRLGAKVGDKVQLKPG